MTTVNPNGNTYSDDGTSARDMRNGGHRAWLLPMISDMLAEMRGFIGATIYGLTKTAADTAVAAAQQAQGYAATAAAGSGNAAIFPAVDKALVAAADVADVFVYDTRLDDRLPDGSRWNEPGRCAALSYWSEALGVNYRGMKRDVPLVSLLVARQQQWLINDALDLDATGAPRLWASSNNSGNGLVACGSAAPITCIFALNGYIYIGTGMGLHVVSLTGDWCDRYDNSGRRRRLGNFAQRNAVLQEGAVFASAALPAVAVTSVHARVLPGAPLDSAGLPIPTIAVATSGGLSVIHPNGIVANITGFANGPLRVHLLPDGRLVGSGNYYDETSVFALPYASTTVSASLRSTNPPSYKGTIVGTSLGPVALTSTAGAGGVGGIPGGYGVGGNVGLSLVAEDAVTPANGMVAYLSTNYATGWQPGDIRLATLCDTATGSLVGAEMVATGDFSASSSTVGWIPADATLAVVGGEAVYTAPAGQAYPGPGYTLQTTAGQTYALVMLLRSPSGSFTQVSVTDGTSGTTLAIFPGTSSTTSVPVPLQFTALSNTAVIHVYIGTASSTAGSQIAFNKVSCRPAALDRSYRARGLQAYGALSRTSVAGYDVAAWGGFSVTAYLEQLYTSDQDVNATTSWEDTVHLACGAGTTIETIISRDSVSSGARRKMVVTTAGTVSYTISDGTNTVTVTSSTTVRDGVSRRVSGKVRRDLNVIELWVAGVKEASASISSVGSLANSAATVRIGLDQQGANPATTAKLLLVRMGARSGSPAQESRAASDEAAGVSVLGGTSTVIRRIERDPLTDRVLVTTDTGSSILRGLLRIGYHTKASITSATSDVHRAGSLRGMTLLIGTSAQVAIYQEAVGGKEFLLAGGPRPVGNGFTIRGVTTDGAALDLAPRVPIGDRETLVVEARIVGRVAGAADTERLTYIRRATYYRDAGGAITLQGSVQTVGTDTEVTGTADATLAIVGDWVSVRVTGVAGKRIAWSASIIINRIGEETSYAA